MLQVSMAWTEHMRVETAWRNAAMESIQAPRARNLKELGWRDPRGKDWDPRKGPNGAKP